MHVYLWLGCCQQSSGAFPGRGEAPGNHVVRTSPVLCLHFLVLSLSETAFVCQSLSKHYSSAQQPSSYIVSVLATENVPSDSNPNAIILAEIISWDWLKSKVHTQQLPNTVCSP